MLIARCNHRHWNLSKSREPLLAVEAGVVGWTLIEYEELLATAIEYLGPSGVLKVSIEERKRYLKEIYKILQKSNVTHYIYDPRTGSQTWGTGIFQSFAIVAMFAWLRIIPVARLSDIADRKWRFQCAIVTAASGICTTVMEPSYLKWYFPHRRLVGPMLMALSHNQALHLQLLQRARLNKAINPVIFTGAMYEPRTTILLAIQNGLRNLGLDLVLQVRKIGDERDSNDAYWNRLVDAKIVVTTADHATGFGAESIDIPHLVYRYSEVLAAGSLLVAPMVPGIEQYFRPGVDFVCFSNTAEAVEKIAYYLDSESERILIAETGSERLRELTKAKTYWKLVDAALGTDGFIQPD